MKEGDQRQSEEEEEEEEEEEKEEVKTKRRKRKRMRSRTRGERSSNSSVSFVCTAVNSLKYVFVCTNKIPLILQPCQFEDSLK